MDQLEVSKLLTSWNLQQLCPKFQEEEICIDALHYLTEQDICELIPKIGPRAIFRAALKLWKEQQQQLQLQQQKQHNISQTFEHPITESVNVSQLGEQEINNTEQELMIQPKQVKLEMEGVEIENHTPLPMVTWETEQTLAASVVEVLPRELAQVLTDEENSTDFDLTYNMSSTEDNDNREANGYMDEEDIEILNVREVLLKSFEGGKVLKFYAVNNTLDKINRRRIVKVIISTILERKMRISPAQFTNLATQIVKEFPNERVETYYVQRTGAICPRGALYNKYLNLCRSLRRAGLLNYHIQPICGSRTRQHAKH